MGKSNKNNYRRVYKSVLRKYGVDKAFVYSYIYDRHINNRDFYFTRNNIANICNISIRSVSNYLKDFESNGDFYFSRGDTFKIKQSKTIEGQYYKVNNALFLNMYKELIILILFLDYLLNKNKDKETDSLKIKEHTGIHNRSVLKYLKELELLGFIRKTRTKRGFLLEGNNKHMINLIESQLDESDISFLNILTEKWIGSYQKIIDFMLQCYILGGYFDVKTSPKDGSVDSILLNILESDPLQENAVSLARKCIR